ncbi:uncharacterized protein LOC129591300 [Paramacrobiotus metropolitanus]|uniref:uncharacterized protein LOC129591300 n=1 Tax=Paramacrobiotus metropolitanus TaxID=2943436 RepID=UPI002446553A|nr:uncharacterized protein LOC129591300 [Paramacrobiotus metropolitanus]
MVNFARFGPLTGAKKAPAVENDLSSGEKGCKMKLISPSPSDVEANLLPVLVASENRSKRAGRWCCMACVADVCAVVALLLIVASTGLLLYKVWWVKKEVDRIEPVVAQLSTDLNLLQAAAQNAAEFDAENDGKTQFTPGFNVSPFDDKLEDVSQDALRQLKKEEEMMEAQVESIKIAALFIPISDSMSSNFSFNKLNDNGSDETVFDEPDNDAFTTESETVAVSTAVRPVNTKNDDQDDNDDSDNEDNVADDDALDSGDDTVTPAFNDGNDSDKGANSD